MAWAVGDTMKLCVTGPSSGMVFTASATSGVDGSLVSGTRGTALGALSLESCTEEYTFGISSFRRAESGVQ